MATDTDKIEVIINIADTVPLKLYEKLEWGLRDLQRVTTEQRQELVRRDSVISELSDVISNSQILSYEVLEKIRNKGGCLPNA